MSLSTKQCPNCRSDALILLYSIDLKVCTCCATEIPWTLDEGQQPMLTEGIRLQDKTAINWE